MVLANFDEKAEWMNDDESRSFPLKITVGRYVKIS